MNVPITPGTLLQDRYFVLRVLRPVEFGWMYRAVDQRNNGSVCLLEEFIIPDRVFDRAAILQQKFTLEMQRFEPQHLPPEVSPEILRGLPGFVETIVEQNRVFIVQTWGDHATYHQVLEDRVMSGEGGASIEEVEAVELLDGLEPLVRSLSQVGLAHGYLCRDTIVWLDGHNCPGLMHFGTVRSIALQYELEAVNEIAVVNEGQTDLQQLASTVLDLLGDRPWNHINIQLANHLRLLLEPEQRSQYRSQMIQQPISSGSQKLPVYASFAAQSQILQSQPQSQSQSEPRSQPNSNGSPAPDRRPLARRRVKKRPRKSPLVHNLTQLVAQGVRMMQQDPALSLMALVTIGLCSVLGYRLIAARLPTPTPSSPAAESSGFKLPASKESPTPESSPTEAVLPADIETKLRSIDISADWFSATVTELTGDTIAPQDPRWQDHATALLKTLETLPPESRRDIGTYRRTSLDTWLTAAQPTKQLDVLSKQVEDATDAEFFKAFPDRKGTALNPRNLGQVWYAIARAEAAKLKR